MQYFLLLDNQKLEHEKINHMCSYCIHGRKL